MLFRSINLPAIPGDQVKGVKVTHLGSRVFHEEIAQMKDPWGKEIHWIGGGHVTTSAEAFERWLDPANFDAEGRQRASLASLR